MTNTGLVFIVYFSSVLADRTWLFLKSKLNGLAVFKILESTDNYLGKIRYKMQIRSNQRSNFPEFMSLLQPGMICFEQLF